MLNIKEFFFVTAKKTGRQKEKIKKKNRKPSCVNYLALNDGMEFEFNQFNGPQGVFLGLLD